jgi:DNA polymerase family A
MIPSTLREFSEIWCADFEFMAPEGEVPIPVCMVAHEIRSGRSVRLWQDKLSEPPYRLGPSTLFVAYYASAELGCHLALKWPLPIYVLDLCIEFKNLTNGLNLPGRRNLLGAMSYFRLDCVSALEKDEMRQLALRGGPWTAEEKQFLLDYCESDVKALTLLFEKMAPKLDLPRALIRGRYMRAVARMESVGVPVDVPMLQELRDHWTDLKTDLIAQVDSLFGVYKKTTFKLNLFSAWLEAQGITWPRTPKGRIATDEDTFRSMAKSYPALQPLHELRTTLGQLRLESLTVGRDGRNRQLLSAFSSKTGRNQPSNAKFIFGPSVWLRFLIKPTPGYALSYLDWSQQEFAIAARLSGDEAMQEAYLSGDPYLAFARQAGAGADQRELFKQCVLATQYGMTAPSLALRIGKSEAEAQALLDKHRRAYAKFWSWSDAVVNHATLHGSLSTVLGWNLKLTKFKLNERSIRNFPMQSNGAEMLRLACSIATEKGISICAPVHDAILIESPLDEIHRAIRTTQAAMAEASRIVLDGFELRSDAKIFTDRFTDARGQILWDTVTQLLTRRKDVRSSDMPLYAART